ncbi:hypothetical protein Scep_024830 [Stephania cephalantha]|uniref:Uncharacterized protein n=1 Tax=Stephania cephalantha TaxID=152367 RepID=A0AAP0HYT8_9MAGN
MGRINDEAAGFPDGTPVDILLNRSSLPKTTFKAKSDLDHETDSKSWLGRNLEEVLERRKARISYWRVGWKSEPNFEHKIAFPQSW